MNFLRHCVCVGVGVCVCVCMSTATPADVSLLMQLGVDGVFVGSGIFKSSNPKKRAVAMVQAVTHYEDAAILAKVSEDPGEPMVSNSGCNQQHLQKTMNNGYVEVTDTH